MTKTQESFLYTIMDYKKPFSGEDFLTKINKSTKKNYSLEEALSFLKNNHYLFQKDGLFIPQSYFFQDAQFLIQPSQWELEQNIFIPGDRFSPFLSPMVFPADVILKHESSQLNAYKVIKCNIDESYDYLSLYGIKGALLYLCSDFIKNEKILMQTDFSRNKINITVFDFKNFYKEVNFQEGDYIQFQVENAYEGNFSLKKLSKAEIDIKKQKNWHKLFEESLKTALKDQDLTNINLNNIIALTLFTAKQKLIQTPADSLYNAVYQNPNISFCTVENLDSNLYFHNNQPKQVFHSFSDALNTDKKFDNNDLKNKPEGNILITENEITAIIRNELFHAKQDYQGAIKRIMANAPPFSHDKELLNTVKKMVQENWEFLKKDYNIFQDQNSGKLRNELLEIIEDNRQWFYKIITAPDHSESDMERLESLSYMLEPLKTLLLFIDQSSNLDQDLYDKIWSLLAEGKEILQNFRLCYENQEEFLELADFLELWDFIDDETEDYGLDIYYLRVIFRPEESIFYRLLQIPGDISLKELHFILQSVLNVYQEDDCSFIIENDLIPIMAEYNEAGLFQDDESSTVMLEDFELEEDSQFIYQIDSLESSFSFEIQIDKIQPLKDYSETNRNPTLCHVLEGKGWIIYSQLDTPLNEKKKGPLLLNKKKLSKTELNMINNELHN